MASAKVNNGVLYAYFETWDDQVAIMESSVKHELACDIIQPECPCARLTGRFCDLVSLIEDVVPEEDEDTRTALVAEIKVVKK